MALLPNEKLHRSLGNVSESVRFSLLVSCFPFLTFLIFPLSLPFLGELRLHFYLIALLIALSALLLLSHRALGEVSKSLKLITAMTNQFPCQTQTRCQVCGWHFPISYLARELGFLHVILAKRDNIVLSSISADWNYLK